MLRSRSLVVSFVGLFAVGAIACGGSDNSDDLFGKTGASAGGQGGGSAGKAGAAGGTQAGSSQGGAGTTGTGGAGAGGVSQGGAAGKAVGGGGGTAGGPVGGKAGAGGTGGKATGGAAGTAGKGGSAGVGGKAGASGTGGSKAGAAGVGGGTVGGSAGTGGGPAGGAAGAGGDPAGGAAGAGGDPAGGAAGAGGDPAGGAAGAGGDPAGGAAGAAGSGGGNPDKCPGSPVSVGPGPKVTIDGSTLTSGNDGRSQNGQCGGTSSNDVVFEVTPTANGRLAIDNTTTFSGSLYARAACGDEGSQIACDGNGSTQSMTIDVQAGVPVWIYVDGFGQTNQAGGFQLSFELFECGDGVVQSGEDCDDGNAAAGDGCDAACRFEQNGPCELQNAEPNTRTMPRKAPASCLTAAFLQPLGPQQGISDNGADEDWYCIDVAEGQTLLAGTFQTAPDSCNLLGNHDTIVEIYKGTPSADPANTSCAGSAALACDDNSGPDSCSVAGYTVPAGEGGTYCARVIDNGKNGSIQFYNAYLAIR